MTNAVYFVGAGLSKSLQRVEPIPLMNDFVKVAAQHAAADVSSNIVLLQLIGLEKLKRFRWASSRAAALAGRIEVRNRDDQVVTEFLAELRRRPAESIEELLTRAVVEPVDDWDAAVHPSPLRFRYAINHIFARIGWDVDLTVLETFVRAVANDGGSHTFINFNYDLFVDRVVSTCVPSWRWHCGYGVPMAFALTVDPGDNPKPVLTSPVHICQSRVQLLKPHGSLNWLVPVKDRAAAVPYVEGPVTVRVTPQHLPDYVTEVPTAAWLSYPPPHGYTPVAPGIIAPTEKKECPIKLFTEIRRAEVSALIAAEDVYILGWSVPATDRDHVDMIREAVTKRASSFHRVVAVNRGQTPEYYERVAQIFGVSQDRVEVWDDGFTDFVVRTAG